MKRYAKLPALLPIIALFLLNNCSRKFSEQTAYEISPPFEKVNISFVENKINAATGGEIKFENGTKIIVPENAFVDKNGNTVKSSVTIRYRDFHNSAQILLSGIPMKYGEENFQTAGMFEISGSMDNNEAVQFAKDKAVKVQMASFTTGDDYDFYYFDSETGQWQLKGKAAAEVNEEKEMKLKSLATVEDKPLKPVKQKGNSFVFDLDVNSKLYPELRDFNGVVWQYSGNDEENNPEKTPWVFTEKWSYVELLRSEEGEGKYSLHLKSYKKDYKTIVSPVLNGKNYKEALAKFESKMNLYEEAWKLRKVAVEQLDREANLLRTFTINNFGIYNWDHFYKTQENAIRLAADFKLNEEIPGVDMNEVTVYLLTGNERAVLPYGKDSRGNFTFNPNDDNKLVVVLPGDRIAVFRNEDFKTIAGTLAGKSSYTFTLDVVNEQVVTAASFANIIASI